MTCDHDKSTGITVAIETSVTHGSVAVGRDDRCLESQAFTGPLRHAVEFLPTLASLCDRHDISPSQIETVCVSAGPGSFTGLRIGITAARMLALANGCRVVPVPSLQATAQNALDSAQPPQHVAVVIDAKRRRVYANAFTLNEEGVYLPDFEPAEVDPNSFLADLRRDTAVLGEGVARHAEAVEASGLPILPPELATPRAAWVYQLGRRLAFNTPIIEPRSLVPTYVRLPEAEERWTQRHPAD